MSRRKPSLWPAHLLLLTGGIAFLFPFLWMLLTSMKTDEELAAGTWWPSIPHFRADADLARPLELRELQLRTLDARIYNLVNGPKIAHTWTIESGNGSLVPTADATRIDYHFASTNSPPLVLRYDFEFPDSSENLHKLLLSIKSDDSWHKLDATLDFGTVHWTTATT